VPAARRTAAAKSAMTTERFMGTSTQGKRDNLVGSTRADASCGGHARHSIVDGIARELRKKRRAAA
jgi:hypothetical protein